MDKKNLNWPDIKKSIMDIPRYDLNAFTPSFDVEKIVSNIKGPGEYFEEMIKKQDTQIATLQQTNYQLVEINQKQETTIKELQDLNKKKDDEIAELKLENKKEKKKFWLTFGISTFISVASLIVAIIALCV